MKKENRLTPEEYAALLERLKTRSLEEGDGEILKAVLEKTLLIGQKYRRERSPPRSNSGDSWRFHGPRNRIDER